MTKMCAAIDEMCRQNQDLGDNVLKIQQHQQEATPRGDWGVGSPTLLDEIWEESISDGFKPLSFAKFDGHSDPYEHVASTRWWPSSERLIS